uniref:SAM-dependent methyltransferase n=1 Tax=Macrostomum lignano TaxID=282301 RepID=A0A1I8F4W1_9PLAT
DLVDTEFKDISKLGVIQVVGDDRLGRKVIIFSACRLPPSNTLDHQRLLKYIINTLNHVKFGRKLAYVNYLSELKSHNLFLDQMPIPQRVREYDERQAHIRDFGKNNLPNLEPIFIDDSPDADLPYA